MKTNKGTRMTRMQATRILTELYGYDAGAGKAETINLLYHDDHERNHQNHLPLLSGAGF